jgi:SNF2 family DNA or RNA helicase
MSDDDAWHSEDSDRPSKRIKKTLVEEQNVVDDIGYVSDLGEDLEDLADSVKQVKVKGRADRYILERNKELRQQAQDLVPVRNAWLQHHRELFEPFFLNTRYNYFTDTMDKIAGNAESKIVPYELLAEQPKDIANGRMKDYQLKGLSWLLYMHDNFTNCILGDEMGLGKTLQTISLFTYLKFQRNESGPCMYPPL